MERDMGKGNSLMTKMIACFWDNGKMTNSKVRGSLNVKTEAFGKDNSRILSLMGKVCSSTRKVLSIKAISKMGFWKVKA